MDCSGATSIGICLQDPTISGEMSARVFAATIPREVEYRGRRRRSTEWSIVANIRPQPAGDRLAFR
jgi:hypothetical protein